MLVELNIKPKYATMKVKSSKSTKEAKPTASASKAEAKVEEVSKITANPRLVAALQNHDESKKAAKSYLVEMATIVQEEQLSKEEIITSIMEARECDRKYAGEQFSRLKSILMDPLTLQQLKDGVIDLQTAKKKTAKSQENKSPKKALENAEKVIIRSCTAICTKMKELGLSFAQVMATFKQIAKKNGIVIKTA